MTGCARTCLLWPLAWIAAACAFFFAFREIAYVDEHIWWASGVAGFCAGTAAALGIGAAGTGKERRLLRDAANGAVPADGAWVAVSGTIHSRSPLRAPLSGVEAVAYEYRITREDTSDSESTPLTYYDGKALAPSTIAAAHGAVRLLSVPSLDVPAAQLDRGRAVEHAKRYVASTAFETRETPRDERRGVAVEAASDDGAFRRDRESHGGTDVAECDFEERHIRNGETVCAFGLYSRARGGLVPHGNWAKPTRLMRGDAAGVAAQLQQRLRRWRMATAGFAAAALVAAAVYVVIAY